MALSAIKEKKKGLCLWIALMADLWDENQTQTSAFTLTWPTEGQQPLLPSQPELER